MKNYKKVPERIRSLVDDLNYLLEAEQLLSSLHTLIGPYWQQDRFEDLVKKRFKDYGHKDLLTQINDHFEFDDSE